MYCLTSVVNIRKLGFICICMLNMNMKFSQFKKRKKEIVESSNLCYLLKWQN